MTIAVKRVAPALVVETSKHAKQIAKAILLCSTTPTHGVHVSTVVT